MLQQIWTEEDERSTAASSDAVYQEEFVNETVPVIGHPVTLYGGRPVIDKKTSDELTALKDL